jgi:hypothetical protein
MKSAPLLILSALTSLVSARVGYVCTGSLSHPCLCLDNGVCKTLGGTPIERDNKGNFPCPTDADNIWGCYIYCD